MIGYLLLVPLAVFAYLLYHLVIKIYLAAWKFKKMDPSLITYIAPFSGMLGVQQENIRKYGDSQRFMKEMVREHPDQKAYFTNLGSMPFLILCDPALVREMSLSPRKFRKFNLYKHSRQSYDEGIFIAEDEKWTSIRGIIRHSFNHEQLKAMIPTMRTSIHTTCESINTRIDESSTKSTVFKVIHDTEVMIGDILIRIFFSEAGAKKKVGDTPLSIALAQFTVTMFDRSRAGPNILFSLFFGEKVKDMNFCKEDRNLQLQLAEIREKISEILDPRMELEDDPEKDFIQHYISEMRKNDKAIAEAEAKGEPHKIRKITKEEIIQQLISFYFAGIDTTGHLVAFALYALAEFPEHRQRIIEEIRR
jgi:cytochrome P450